MEELERLRRYAEIRKRIAVAHKAKSVTASAYWQDMEFLMDELEKKVEVVPCRKPIDWNKVKGWFFREKLIPSTDGYIGVNRGELPQCENYGYDPESNQ
jgi:hypothetical protein